MDNENYQIPFTQYLRPNGKKEVKYFMTPRKEVFYKSQKIINEGLVLTCEVLTNEFVSFTISDDKNEKDLVTKTCKNNEIVVAVVEAMILNYGE